MTDGSNKAEAQTATGAAKKWYKSTTIQALVASAVVLVVLPRMGIEIPAEYSTEIYAALAGAVILGLRKASGGLAL